MRDLKTLLLPVILFACVTTLLGCSSPQGIAVNPQQTVVMDPSVLTAGILASQPVISASSGKMLPARCSVTVGTYRQKYTIVLLV